MPRADGNSVSCTGHLPRCAASASASRRALTQIVEIMLRNTHESPQQAASSSENAASTTALQKKPQSHSPAAASTGEIGYALHFGQRIVVRQNYRAFLFLQPDDPGIDAARPQAGPHQMRHDRKDQRREDDQHDRRRNRPRGSVPPPALEHGKQNPCRIGQQVADDESPQRKIQSIHNHES